MQTRENAVRRRASRTIFAGIAVAAVTAGGLSATALGTAAGNAQASPVPAQVPAQGTTWCPGQALPFDNIQWDMSTCHTWYMVPFGKGNVRMVDLNGNPLDSFIAADIAPPILTPPPPPPGKPPGTPFCTPRGALIIIPPICDEIGVDWPPGSLPR